MKTVKTAAGVGAVLGLCGLAMATVTPNTYEIRVSNVVSPSMTSTTVEVYAQWDADLYYAFQDANWNLVGDTTGGFSGPASAFVAPGQVGGTPTAGDVMGIVTGQLHVPMGGVFADTSDPILIWTGTWSTTDFTPRIVDLFTETDEYRLFSDDTGAFWDVTPTVLEAAGQIQVIPAPASIALLGLGGLATLRRRR